MKTNNEYFLFRIHKNPSKIYLNNLKEFIEGYLNLNEEKGIIIFDKVHTTAFENIVYDVYIQTENMNVAKMAHACGWTYITLKME